MVALIHFLVVVGPFAAGFVTCWMLRDMIEHRHVLKMRVILKRHVSRMNAISDRRKKLS